MFLLLVDDLKIFKVIRDVSDCVDLQKCLNNFHRWCTLNDFTLNINKCNSISLHWKRFPITTFSYSMNSIFLIPDPNIKDLDVIFSSNLSFNKHIDYI